jgi:hypothetical protein
VPEIFSLDTNALLEAARAAESAVDLLGLAPTPAALADAVVRALTVDGAACLAAGEAPLARLVFLAGALAAEVDLARALALADAVADFVAAADLPVDDPRRAALAAPFAGFDLERVPLDRVRPERWRAALARAAHPRARAGGLAGART